MSLLWNCRYHLLLEQFVLFLLDPHCVVILSLDLRLTHLVREEEGEKEGENQLVKNDSGVPHKVAK